MASFLNKWSKDLFALAVVMMAHILEYRIKQGDLPCIEERVPSEKISIKEDFNWTKASHTDLISPHFTEIFASAAPKALSVVPPSRAT